MKDIKDGLYVTDLVGSGVNTVTGDYSRGAAGFWIEIGELTYPVSEMTIAGEEIFGPVLSILTYGSDEEAIDMANDTIFGLHAYVMSSNPARAKAVATRLQAGPVMINTLQHDPLAPFGGFKQSGVGREYGVLGLESYLEAKTLLGVS